MFGDDPERHDLKSRLWLFFSPFLKKEGRRKAELMAKIVILNHAFLDHHFWCTVNLLDETVLRAFVVAITALSFFYYIPFFFLYCTPFLIALPTLQQQKLLLKISFLNSYSSLSFIGSWLFFFIASHIVIALLIITTAIVVARSTLNCI